MPVINSNAKEIHSKIIYYGTQDSGKTSIFDWIQNKSSQKKLKTLKIPAEPDIEAMVLSAGGILGFQNFFHIYKISSKQSLEEKPLLFHGVDGVVFVANSDLQHEKDNETSFKEMEDLLKINKKDMFKIPMAIQYNKRDIEQAISLESLRAKFNKYNNKDFQSSVPQGIGIMEPLKHVCRLIILSIRSSNFL